MGALPVSCTGQQTIRDSVAWTDCLAYLTALPLLCGSLDFTALLTGRFAMAGRRERGLELTGGGAAAGIRGGRRAALHALRDRQLAPQPAAQRRPA